MKFDAVVLPVEQYRTTSPSKFVELLSEECKVDIEILDSKFINGQLYYGITYSCREKQEEFDIMMNNNFVSENIYKYCDRVFLTKQGKKKGVKIRLNRGE